MRILDRYLLKNFLVPFLYCFFGFIAIWLAFDLAQRTDDLMNSRLSPATLLYYYATQVPAYVVLMLPAALLLALLYSLSKMSRSNEIISMLACGISLYRLVTPLIVAGVAVSALSFAMNCKLAPHANIFKKVEMLSREKNFHDISADVEKQRRIMEDAKDKYDEIRAHTQAGDGEPGGNPSKPENAGADYMEARENFLKQQKAFDELLQRKQTFFIMDSQLFRNRADSRTWLLQLRTYVLSPYQRASHPDLSTVKSAEITQQDKDGNIIRNYFADGMTYDAADHTWTFYNGKTVDFDPNALDRETGEEYWDTLKIKDWSETPWRVFSTDLDAANLSLPELRDYLHYNADFPESQLAAYRTYYYRQGAVPAGCLVIVFIAAPLGIVYSRRGVLAGVAGAIFIFFGIMFLDTLFLALGKHGTLPPLFAAWGTDMIFGAVGLFLLYMRAGNRELFKFHPKNFMHLFKQA